MDDVNFGSARGLARWSPMLQEYAVADCCCGIPLKRAEDKGQESREEFGKICWGGVYEDVEAVSNRATRLAYH